jgi:hypothetical protein
LQRGRVEIATNFNDFSPTLTSNARLKKVPPTRNRFRTEREHFMWRDFTKTLREAWQASSGGYGSYRPDLHYMRGPGPKWHAKYGGLVPTAQISAGSRNTGRNNVMVKVAERRA